MTRFLGLLLVLVVLVPPATRADTQSFEQMDMGRYLATAADCVACHTASGGKPFAGGRRIETPFGVLVSPNITPDRETGIGSWTDDDFVRAMRKGIGPRGEHFYPAFPYPWFTKMTRDDVLRIRRYLATLEPANNRVQTNQLPFPFRIRSVMIGWNALFFAAKPFAPHPDKSAEWNRGAYLVEGPAHCGACHTAKNALGADKDNEAFEGAKLEGWVAPDLTGDPRGGLATWTADEIIEYLKTGRNRAAAASGPMGEVVTLSTSHMTDPDLRAIAAYLKDLPAGHETTANAGPAVVDATVTATGKTIFQAQCAACHQRSGAGIIGLFPALANAPDVQSSDPTNLLRAVLQGEKSVATPARPTGAAMPAFDWKLSDQQIAAVTTYIRNEWGNRAAPVVANDVASARRELRRAE